ncbi:MAG: trypsin-like peptidase domain-containing protein [Opitutales bacterium]
MLKKSRSLLSFAAAGLVAGTFFWSVAGGQDEAPDYPEPTLQVDASPLPRQESQPVYSYADMLEEVTPAVVSIAVERRVPERPTQNRGDMSREEMMEELLRRFFGRPGPSPMEPDELREDEPEDENGPDRFLREGQGSGFIVSPEGFVLTNNHVVRGRAGMRGETVDFDEMRIIVQLADGREYDAEIVGTDPQTDLAVLKIDGDGLPVATLGDSSNLRVGDIAFAVGNPLGVGLTVSQGIISALNRTDLGIIERSLRQSGADINLLPPIENFIQTDAAINMGNSGGVLVDARGRVVGINSAISSITGGSIGIGFAIPINLAERVMSQLIRGDELSRGFIGVSLEEMTREKAEAFGLQSTRGVIINGVSEGLPADNAGLEPGDVVLAVDNEEVDSVRDMVFLISSRLPGSEVTLDVVRWGERMEIPVTLGDRVALLGEGNGPATMPRQGSLPDGAQRLAPGLVVKAPDAGTRETFGLSPDGFALEIVEIDFSTGLKTNLKEGLVILEINGRQPADLESARNALRRPGNNAVFAINAESRRAFYWLTLPGNGR